MMHYTHTHFALRLPMEDSGKVRKQLQREITCLEMQLQRLHLRDEFLDLLTQQTYEEMISSRKSMLDTL